MACIRPSYCYARQKFGSSMSAGSFVTLISQSKAVGSRKKKMNQCDVPDTFLTPCFLLVVTSFFHSFPVFLNFSFLSRQYSRVMRAVLCSRECNFSIPKINSIKKCIKKRFRNNFFYFPKPLTSTVPVSPPPPPPSSGLQL